MQTRDLRERLAPNLDPDPRPYPPPGSRLAAVLVPIVEAGQPLVVFTRRADHLPRHPGEISFPGGLPHPSDAGLRETALRETEEELGLPRTAVDVVGALAPIHTTVSGILIVPYVGMLAARPSFAPNVGEIAEIFEYPLTELAEAETEVELLREGGVYRGYAYQMPGSRVWGATALILHGLIEILRKEPA
ncbi:MAG: CoA pyrophosphatase [Actinomycetota bacterium]